MALRIIFMGTPDFSVATLKALHAAGHEIVAAYSQPPRPGGRRGLDLQKSPVHQAAEELGIEVRHPLNFRDQASRAQSYLKQPVQVAKADSKTAAVPGVNPEPPEKPAVENPAATAPEPQPATDAPEPPRPEPRQAAKG